MSRNLSGFKIAILVANGFNEKDLTALQRPLIQAGANTRLISTENGLVHSWNGESWGLHYAVDTPLSAALGADYDMLVIPGGSRSMEKLRLTAHTRRFVNSFAVTGKPVAVCGEAQEILVFAGVEAGNVIADACDDESRASFAAKVIEFFATKAVVAQEAAAQAA